MYDIATRVAAWLDDARTVHVAQVVATAGFSSGTPGAAYAWTDDGEQIGTPIPGVTGLLTESGGRLDGHLAEITVSDDDAMSAGLSCGGTATLFVQDAASFPTGTWRRLARREPMCLVSEIVGSDRGTTSVYSATDVRDAPRHPDGVDIARLFARGVTATALTPGEHSQVVVALWPSTELLVVGGGSIATALADSAMLLGWSSAVTDDAAVAVDRIERLTESDAIVVLSHDRATDVPALAAALASRAGYVGALGSRGTQAARRHGLIASGLPADQLARLHGPAGLDIDAHTPAEIAVSIVAEVLANRSGSSGGSISRREGPVHTAGVHAPPPRN
jgi:xanthine dehydrogenase accessory factor